MKSIILFSSILHLVYGGLHRMCIGPEGTHESVFLEPDRSIDYCNRPGHSLKLEFDLEDRGIHSIKIYFINEDGRYAEDDTAYKIEEYKHGHGFHSRNLKIENFENGKYVLRLSLLTKRVTNYVTHSLQLFIMKSTAVIIVILKFSTSYFY
ncbi:hypothetical protein CONCODRAFT_2101 [Conidiobolus coronatus NRRL 28638]|uniref:GOLD domain-containing protein n=1 Tax=Conidiobolus coronatus (strain ATCC 28846 / CBS 209.66 / NRRL 28638) TaxID=796925 RepID=A0A137PIG2_CONC2|nr:hypothetical protein CONCODRAFT_2101 [Conidiobolus coronatus NRRL 28638]|eukprot:KXN74779.1 hypothetical protein CONCODRAFT_2101 [Conidiobolus coronatus NRRL 28638]